MEFVHEVRNLHLGQGTKRRRLPSFVPPGFDAAKKYPVKFLDSWRAAGGVGRRLERIAWNAELFAANGYVVIMINPRGSTGYGAERLWTA